MELSEITKRLSYIKYLYHQGVELSNQSDVVSGYSILAFHDSVEMFLMLVCEHKDKSKDNKKMMMMDYLGALPEARLKVSMKALNECRIALKHHGQFPNKVDVEKHRINTGTFLAENCQDFFGIDFERVSLANLVSYAKIREIINSAQDNLANGNLYQCLVDSRLAFECLIEEFEENKVKSFSSIYNIGKKPSDKYKDLIKQAYGKNISQKDVWFSDISETISELRNIVKLTSLGIDYKKYALFHTVTPKVIKTASIDNPYCIQPEVSLANSVKITEELCRMCITFVIDSAVTLQDSDYDLSKYLKLS